MHHLYFLSIRNSVATNSGVGFHEDVCFNFFNMNLKLKLKGQDVTLLLLFSHYDCVHRLCRHVNHPST